MLIGCRAKPTAAPVLVVKKPLIDLSQGEVGFPLDLAAAPASPGKLREAIETGYVSRLDAKSPKARITVDGADLKKLARLSIELSGCSVNPNYEPKVGKKAKTFTPLAHADYFEYRADPLQFQKHASTVIVEAHDATLVLAPASEAGKQLMCLENLSTGRVVYQSRMSDLRQSILAGVKLRSPLTFSLDGVDLELTSRDPHNLEMKLLLRARLLLVPANIEVTGQVDIDDQKNVVLTRLSAHGLDPSGAIVAGLMQGAMDKVNNRAAPLTKFPNDHIRVADIRCTVGEAFRIEVDLERK